METFFRKNNKHTVDFAGNTDAEPLFLAPQLLSLLLGQSVHLHVCENELVDCRIETVLFKSDYCGFIPVLFQATQHNESPRSGLCALILAVL